ncbi:MAG: hypothetical protein NT123_16250 [Proteobacteria bacterium]|nr:hypothetical protein [Pseudomonadota bacterium]
MATYVRYIDRIREYYLSKYNNPYRWAHFEDVPFTPLKKPLAESRVVLVTTSQTTARNVERKESDGMQNAGGMYSLAVDTPLDLLYSPADNYDTAATTLDDVNAFYPTSRLHEAVASGRIGSLTERFHGVYNAYSHRRTRERDIPAVLERCREDGADVAVLTPV